ncbi:hypothetical protein [Plantibacter sp. CFBP 8775]|uniref:hypothetical protein n=1 Tax=Plantibacter sp. CFBP 8775 TaxID=2774038 RepID=UPI00177D41E2|nr:hypothetical protein [Plantibacter sp. CFBP 8775]MBD8104775.1 hypothetical protein [Plantibacter sp. CFBP 8775]
MGSNRRYGSDVSRAAVNAAVTRPKPVSLTEQERRSSGPGVHTPDEPARVLAWVRYPEQAVQVEGEAIAFNDRAVLVRFPTHGGGFQEAWVWRSAVTRPADATPRVDRP